MYYQLTGLVLDARTAAEADKQVTIYTREWGRITVVVPGARKIKAKLSVATEPVTMSEFHVYTLHQAAWPRVTGARLTRCFPPLRSDWRRFTLAQYCAETLKALTPPSAENPAKFDLLLRTWELLESARSPRRIVTAFVLRLLKLSGYNFVDFLRMHPGAVPAGDHHLIQRCCGASGEELDREPALDGPAETRVWRFVEGYLDLHLERPSQTRQFLDKTCASVL